MHDTRRARYPSIGDFPLDTAGDIFSGLLPGIALRPLSPGPLPLFLGNCLRFWPDSSMHPHDFEHEEKMAVGLGHPF